MLLRSFPRVRRPRAAAAMALAASAALAGAADGSAAIQAVDATVPLTCTGFSSNVTARVVGAAPSAARPGDEVTLTNVSIDVTVGGTSGTTPFANRPGTTVWSLFDLGVTSAGAQEDRTITAPGLPVVGGSSTGPDVSPKHYRLGPVAIGAWTAGRDVLKLRLGPIGLRTSYTPYPTGPQPTQAPGGSSVPPLPSATFDERCVPVDGAGELVRVAAAPTVPAPAITALKPSIGPAGSKVTILGTDLAGATEVSFSGTPVEFEQVSATEISATAPTLNFIKAPPPIIAMDVSVTTPGGPSANTEADDFRYFTGLTDDPPKTEPIDKTVKLTCTNTGTAGGFAPRTVGVRITGDPIVRPAFAGTTTVGGLRAEIAFDPDALRPQVVQTLGAVNVSITSLGVSTIGSTLESSHATIPFPFVKPTAPLTLPTAPVRVDIATRLKAPVTGSYGPFRFQEFFEGKPLYLEPLSMRIESLPIGGPSTVSQVNCVPAANQSELVYVTPYSVPNPVQPEITSISPASGAPGTLVTIKGKFLYNAESVSFLYGSTADITPVSDGELRVRVPDVGFTPDSPIETRVTVDTDHGESFVGDAARFIILPLPLPAVPVVRSVSPRTATAGFGQVLLIRGTRFGKVSKVLVGKRSAPFVQLGPSQILAFAPAQPKGGYLLTVMNAAGASVPGPSTLITYR